MRRELYKNEDFATFVKGFQQTMNTWASNMRTIYTYYLYILYSFVSWSIHLQASAYILSKHMQALIKVGSANVSV